MSVLANVARVELDLSEAWAREHPDFAIESLLTFLSEYPAPQWRVTIQPAYMPGMTYTLRATRNEGNQ